MKFSQDRTTSRQARKQDKDARFSTAFSFMLRDGREVFPIRMKRRETGRLAFRISPGGAGGNTLEAGREVEENEMIRYVLEHGYAVRCAPRSGTRKTPSLYKPGHRAVRSVQPLSADARRLWPGYGQD